MNYFTTILFRNMREIGQVSGFAVRSWQCDRAVEIDSRRILSEWSVIKSRFTVFTYSQWGVGCPCRIGQRWIAKVFFVTMLRKSLCLQ